MNPLAIGGRGRGSGANPVNRFEALSYTVDEEEGFVTRSTPDTCYYKDNSKSIIAWNDSPDVGHDADLNPYRGCEHGCVYCYARPTHEYLGFSAGLDFETQIMVKEDAPVLLRKALSAPNWKPQPVGLSGGTDAYQPIERKLQLTRGCLEVFRDFRNPVIVITKNRLVTRDIDILAELAGYRAVAVFISVTTLDLSLNRILEPRSSTPAQRLEAIRMLADAGIPVGTLVAPVIPGLTDPEVPAIVEAVAHAGAQFATYIVLRLPLIVAPLFESWLDTHFPGRKKKVMNRVRAMHGGKLYRSQFGERMTGTGPFAEQLRDIFAIACRRAGIDGAAPTLSTKSFKVPTAHGAQLSLFA